MIDALVALAAYGFLATASVWIVGRSLSARIDELQAEAATWRRLAQQEHAAAIHYLEARLREART